VNSQTRDALERTGAFTPDDIELLERTEDGPRGTVTNWPVTSFQEVLDDVAKGIVAHQAMSLVKAGDAPSVTNTVVLPDFPPYLAVGEDGKPVGYNPSDPSQYWTDADTGELWRWDGKGREVAGASRTNSLGQLIPVARWPNGEPHRVTLVKHLTVNGIRIPDLQAEIDANNAEHDWFHQGYGVWVGKGGKTYGEVPQEVRSRVRLAMDTIRPQASLVLRPPRAG